MNERRSSSERIGDHLRSNVVGYVAVFIALTIAPAWAGGLNADKDRGKAKVAAKKGKRGPRGFQGPPGAQGLQGPQGIQGPPGGGGLPSGAVPAGGDLAGSYPSPVIGPDAVGTAEVDGTLTGADISDTGGGTLGSADIGSNAVGGAEVINDSLNHNDLGTLSGLQLAGHVAPAGGIDFGTATLHTPDDNTLETSDRFIANSLLTNFASLSSSLVLDATSKGSILMREQSPEPADPSADRASIYVRQSGTGLTQLVVKFADGNIDVLAEEAP